MITSLNSVSLQVSGKCNSKFHVWRAWEGGFGKGFAAKQNWFCVVFYINVLRSSLSCKLWQTMCSLSFDLHVAMDLCSNCLWQTLCSLSFDVHVAIDLSSNCLWQTLCSLSFDVAMNLCSDSIMFVLIRPCLAVISLISSSQDHSLCHTSSALLSMCLCRASSAATASKFITEQFLRLEEHYQLTTWINSTTCPG